MTHSSDRPSNPFGAIPPRPSQKPSLAERAAADAAAPRPVPDAAGGHKPNYARFIPREELAGFAAWKPSSFGDKRPPPVAAAPDPEELKRAAQREAQRRAELAAQREVAEVAARAAELRGAREGGYQDGYRDGMAALEAFKQSYASQCSAQVASVIQRMQAQFDTLEQHLAQRVAGIALEVARQVVRTELHTHIDNVVAVTQEALAVLLVSAKHVTVRVHPDELSLVAAGTADVLSARGARLVADAHIERGGCLVESDIGAVDARVATRWERATAAVGWPSQSIDEAQDRPLSLVDKSDDGDAEPAA
jgi:flagellar assembly protein FliH